MKIALVLLVSVMLSSAANARDSWLQPFSASSPWNTAIGSNAVFEPTNFRPATWMTIDEEYFFVTNEEDPRVNLYAPIDWAHRCGGSRLEKEFISFPESVIIPDARDGHTPNNCAAILQPDGQTVIQINPLARCQFGGPLSGWKAPTVSLYSDGLPGGHGGSGLSSLGGSLRWGELSSDQPIRHALKVNIWGKKYLWKFTEPDSGFVWPANRQDGCAPDCYGGTNPSIRLGSLLAIPAEVADTLSLETIPARKLLATFRDYGAYVVDDTAWDVYALCVQREVRGEFRTNYDMAIEAQSGPWYQDCMKLFGALHVVVNNGPTSIGGGGTPRQPTLEPFEE